MGRAVKNKPVTSAATKLVATGEYILTQVGPLNSDYANYTIWTYNYPKQKAANETYLYMSAQFNSLEAYSYAPAPCIRCTNQTADLYNGSQYHFGYSGSEREFNLHTTQNYAHSESLDGRSANISSSNFGVGAVPIIIRWDTLNGSGNRPGHTFCPTARAGAGTNGSQTSAMDSRGESIWYGYLRVWEIAY
jgi:hypothetical protein